MRDNCKFHNEKMFEVEILEGSENTINETTGIIWLHKKDRAAEIALGCLDTDFVM